MRELAIAAIRDPVLLANMPRFRSHPCSSDPPAIAPGCLRLVWALLGGLLALAPSVAAADLYKWTDERGATVLSNVPPPNPRRVTNFEVVVKESAGAPDPRVASSQQHDITATEKLLLDRIDSLERQLQAQQSARETSIVAASPPNPYYAAPMPEYAGNYYPGYYPSWVFPYPTSSFYSYPLPPSGVVFRARGAFPHASSFTSSVTLSRPAVVIRTR
jgi:hypothetical protein